MKIAIHNTPGTFSDKWIEYCEQNSINYKIVNCYASDIILQLEDCQGLMWHWLHSDSKAMLFARQLTYTLQKTGKKVFPDANTCWHFDDKVGQKYLLEAIGAPLVPSYVFYDKEDAINWAQHTTYPKVFKLRGGAGSLNVSLVNNKTKAIELIERVFGNGISPIPSLHTDIRTKLKKIKSVSQFWKKITKLNKYVEGTKNDKKMFALEKGYAYFQEFIPNNDHDIRVIVIGKKAFAIKRMVRDNDFRASGSGMIIHDEAQIPLECIKSGFQLAQNLNTQCVAFDYIFQKDKMLLVEISYGFATKGYLNCSGYWDDDLKWHQGTFTPEWFMISDFIESFN